MKPCVLLLGIDTPIGLAIVRELGKHGVEVHGIGRSHGALASHSRFLAAAHVRAPAEELLQQVVSLTGAPERWMLMAISEGDIAWVNAHREALRPLRCLVPSAQSMMLATDKRRTLELAAGLGIAVPRAWDIHSPDDSARVARECTFPLVLKWSDPAAVSGVLVSHGIELLKTEYCDSLPELDAALRRYAPLGQFPIVQEYCAGRGLGQFVFMHRGEPIRTFQHRRLHEWPPEGGFSTLCESLPASAHAPLMERSIALLRSMNWEGAAMVEYRYDDATGRAVLMEVNGRFWGSLPLAVHCGAGFCWLTYSVLGLGTLPVLPEPRSDLQCRFGIPDLKRLLTIVFRPERIQDRTLRFDRAAELADFFVGMVSPRMRYFVWRLDDPLPFLMDVWNGLKKIVRAGRRGA
ncbi:MAG: carboxylate--amine ligase [Betaproteobacteria bacterium]